MFARAKQKEAIDVKFLQGTILLLHFSLATEYFDETGLSSFS